MAQARFKGLIFDMDGTLTKPVIDFGAIRRELAIPIGDLTVEIERLAPSARRKAWAIIEAHEERALHEQTLQDGCLELLRKCRNHSLKVGLVTRNAGRSVDHFCERHGFVFDGVVTREFDVLKPHPGPVLHLLRAWSLPARSVLTIGDYLYDIQSGQAAGTRTCFFQNPGAAFHGQDADFTCTSMLEIDRIVFEHADGEEPENNGRRAIPGER